MREAEAQKKAKGQSSTLNCVGTEPALAALGLELGASLKR
jgi:hypothetical protein